MTKKDESIQELLRIHKEILPEIKKTVTGFKNIWKNGNDNDLFIELAFCLLTPQSGARRCWSALQGLIETGSLYKGCASEISCEINTVRFKNNKAGYICAARERFIEKGESLKEHLSRFTDPKETREWLVKEIKGYGWKEASHFLRNIGFGETIAILDRHILRNMVRLGIMDEIPTGISRALYLNLELKLEAFAEETGIPMGHLDFVLWYRETGDLFK
jgi:N-glycosylase/DNA lyase